MKKYSSFFLSRLVVAFLLLSPSVFAQNLNRVDVTDNANLVGFYNVRYGNGAGSLMSGNTALFNSNNAFLGYYAGGNANGSSSGQNLGNTMVGGSVGFNNTTGSFNSFLGYGAGYFNKTANSNVFVGNSAGFGSSNFYTAGGNNTGIGTNSLSYLTTGTNNTAVGFNAMSGTNNNFLTGTYNIALGDNAGKYLTSADNNILIGKSAGFASQAANLTGDANIAIGQEAGYKLNTAANNMLMGYQSGYNLTTSSGNIFIGRQSGYYQTTVSNANNTYVGNNTGLSNVSGLNNTFLGQSAGYYYKSNRNTIVGSNAGLGDAGNTSGDDNTYLGFNAGANSYGTNNTLLGSFAGSGIGSGTSNIFIGKSAGTTTSSGYSNILIGTFARAIGPNAASVNNAVAIGQNATVNKNFTIILGDTSVNMQVGIGTLNPTQRLTIKGNFSFVAYNDGMFYKNKRFLFQDEQENIALGTNHEENFEGRGNLLLGVNSRLSTSNLNNSTAIGNDAIVSISNGLVLGNQDVFVGVGTSSPTARLEVASGKDGESGLLFTNLKNKNQNQYLSVNQKGEVILQKQRIQISKPDEWSDKVFEQNYPLKSLSEVENFVKVNKHLPNIPSAQEMTDKGIESEKLSVKLLEKIEELTLYMIEMQKENIALKTRLLKLENK